jgi:hypothetical protein
MQALCNLIEKEYVAPQGDTSKIPMPHPSPQTDPSKYMAHAHMESTAILVLTLSAIRSANACPFTTFAGSYRILNSHNAKIHFPNWPFNTGADSICFMTSDLQMIITLADSRI